MLKVNAHFCFIPGKGKTVVCFVNIANNEEVARVATGPNETIATLANNAQKKFDAMGTDFEIVRTVNGSRYSESKLEIVTAEPVEQSTIDKVVMVLTEEIAA